MVQFSGLIENILPDNVHLLTLEPWGPSTVLLRLENFVGSEDPVNVGTSSVNLQVSVISLYTSINYNHWVPLQELFVAFKVEAAKETTLAGNQWLQDNERLRFNNEGSVTTDSGDDNEFLVTLDPMQIKTFIVTVSY